MVTMALEWQNIPSTDYASLQEGFINYAKFGEKGKASENMTLKNADKWLKDSKVFGKKLTTTDTSIGFKQVVGVKSRHMTFEQFKTFLQRLANKDKANAQKQLEQIVASLAANREPSKTAVTTAINSAGVRRLTDVSTYSGAHKERFDKATGKGLGKAGREDPKSASYVQGYKNSNKYDATRKVANQTRSSAAPATKARTPAAKPTARPAPAPKKPAVKARTATPDHEVPKRPSPKPTLNLSNAAQQVPLDPAVVPTPPPEPVISVELEPETPGRETENALLQSQEDINTQPLAAEKEECSENEIAALEVEKLEEIVPEVEVSPEEEKAMSLEPVELSEPDVVPEPEVAPESEVVPEAEIVPEAEVVAEPEVVPEPEVAEPDLADEPQVIGEPDMVADPDTPADSVDSSQAEEVSAEPSSVVEEPEVVSPPEVVPEPESLINLGTEEALEGSEPLPETPPQPVPVSPEAVSPAETDETNEELIQLSQNVTDGSPQDLISVEPTEEDEGKDNSDLTKSP